MKRKYVQLQIAIAIYSYLYFLTKLFEYIQLYRCKSSVSLTAMASYIAVAIDHNNVISFDHCYCNILKLSHTLCMQIQLNAQLAIAIIYSSQLNGYIFSQLYIRLQLTLSVSQLLYCCGCIMYQAHIHMHALYVCVTWMIQVTAISYSKLQL